MVGAGLLTMVLAVGLAAQTASGERSQKGNIIVSVDGGISPLALPRNRPAPVGIEIDGRIRTADRSQLPRVNQIELALAGRGLLFTKGLPVCSKRRLSSADTGQALARCGKAMVGTGSIEAIVYVPHQRPFRMRSRLLAFNGRGRDGGPAVWVHAYSPDPPVSVVLPFIVERRHGRFRTALIGSVPRTLGPLPRLSAFRLSFSRRFRHGGRLRSYLSATCPVPGGFTAGFLSFARATYRFADGRRLSAESVRSCRARDH